MVYLDNASTTQVKVKSKAAVNYHLDKNYGNPMSAYGFAEEPKEAIDNSRKIISELMECEPENIIFTSGGSEANNLAIKGVAFKHFADTKKPGHIITTEIEHHSILNACKQLEDMGIATVTYIKPTNTGRVYNDMISEAMTDNTILVSIGMVNNEIGTMQKINQLSEFVHKHKILFHTDAVQAFGKMQFSLDNIDFVSVSGHKWGAPKGIGFLYVKDHKSLLPLISGGNQEYGLRGGTHNVPYIAGIGIAAKVYFSYRINAFRHETAYRIRLWEGLSQLFPKLKINGYMPYSVPNILNINLSEYGIRGEEMVAFLSEKEIYVATGSACATGETSHVLRAIGLSEEEADCSIRISTGGYNAFSEIDEIISAISEGITYLRKDS